MLNLVLNLVKSGLDLFRMQKEPAAHAIPPWSPTGVLSMRLRLIRGAWGDRTHAKKERELAQTRENFREKRAVSLRVPFSDGRIRLF